ncbi:MAG: hypothetical protein IPQ07_14390 [Myxococcales bacterium]|nr:hypothetical protein [Myxococcales bacterium]
MRNPWKLTSFALAAMLATSIGHGALNTAAADAQPKMHAALDSLKSAVSSLEGATADKGGHRVKAISLAKQAISEVEQGIKFDNKN